MKVKHIVITSCRSCPFMVRVEGKDRPTFMCEAIQDKMLSNLGFSEGQVMSPISQCPLDDYDTDLSPDSIIRKHVRERADRYKADNEYIKERNISG